MCLGDVDFISNDVATVNLKQSKTDPFRKGVQIPLFCNGTSPCPVCALHTYLHKRKSVHPPSSDRESLFHTLVGEPLCRKTFMALLHKTFQMAGLSHQNYTGHSFMIGAATSCLQIEDHMIKTMGRWASDSYCRYIRTALQAAKMSLAQITCTGGGVTLTTVALGISHTIYLFGS